MTRYQIQVPGHPDVYHIQNGNAQGYPKGAWRSLCEQQGWTLEDQDPPSGVSVYDATGCQLATSRAWKSSGGVFYRMTDAFLPVMVKP